MKPLCSLLACCLLPLGAVQAATYVAVDVSSSLWKPMLGDYDFHADQQTGQSEADIVGGSGVDSGFLITFHDNDTVSAIDGTLAFRVRLDAPDNKNNPAYSGLVWVAIDANNDGNLDVFLGANMQGNNNTNAIEIRAPGDNVNTSPSTTSVANSAFMSYSLTNANYNYRPVDVDVDGVSTDDISGNGDIDYYLSFMVPFADIVAYLGGQGSGSSTTPIVIDDTTPLRFVIATAKQANTLNQDLGGIEKGVNSSSTWEQLGGITAPIVLVPEPSSSMLTLAALAAGCFIRRRR